MTVTRCASSQLMTGLLAWRNPQGSEERWINNAQFISNRWKHIGKVAITEIGLLALTASSVIETVAYSALASLSLILYPCTDRPFKFFAKLLESSSFTVIWALADAAIYNPFLPNVMTRESFARYWVNQFNLIPINLFRSEDLFYLVDWQQNNHIQMNDPLLNPLISEAKDMQTLIDEGANLINEKVLVNVGFETKTLFKEMDPSTIMFVLTKTIFIYALGSECNSVIPNFFKGETKTKIQELRKQKFSQKITQELERVLADLTPFNEELKEKSAEEAFTHLRGIASRELNGLFITRCFKKAIELLNKE